MTKKAEPKKVKKLAVKRTTVKDLDVQPKRGDGVRGGAATRNTLCNNGESP